MTTSRMAIETAKQKGYSFDSTGQLLGLRGLPLKLSKDSHGYPRFGVTIKLKGKKHVYGVLVHRYKAYLLFGKRLFEKGIEVRHLNGNITDFSDSNITIGTASDNYHDVAASKRYENARRGARKLRKFTFEEVEEIRDRIEKVGLTNLSKELGVAKSTLSYIKNRKTYTIP